MYIAPIIALLLLLTSPQKAFSASRPPPTPTSWLGYVVSSVISLTAGAVVTCYWKNSENREENRKIREENLIKQAYQYFFYLKKQYPALFTDEPERKATLGREPTLDDLALIEYQAQELAQVTTQVQKHLKDLQKVRSSEQQQDTLTLLADAHRRGQAALDCIMKVGNELKQVKQAQKNRLGIAPLITLLSSQTTEEKITHLEAHFNATPTKDGVWGMPLIAAAHTLTDYGRQLTEACKALDPLQGGIVAAEKKAAEQLKHNVDIILQVLCASPKFRATTEAYRHQLQTIKKLEAQALDTKTRYEEARARSQEAENDRKKAENARKAYDLACLNANIALNRQAEQEYLKKAATKRKEAAERHKDQLKELEGHIAGLEKEIAGYKTRLKKIVSDNDNETQQLNKEIERLKKERRTAQTEFKKLKRQVTQLLEAVKPFEGTEGFPYPQVLALRELINPAPSAPPETRGDV